MLLGGCNEHADPSLWDSVEKPWDGDLYLKLNVAVAENNNALLTRVVDGYENPMYETEKLQTLRVIIVQKGGEGKNDYVCYNNYYDFRNSLRDDNLRYKVDFSTNYRIYLIGNEGGLKNLNINIESDEEDSDPINTLLTKKLDKGNTYVDGTLENLVISAAVSQDYIYYIIDNETSSSDKVNIPMTEIYDVETIERPQTNQENVKVEMTKDMFLTRAATKFSFTFKRGTGFETDNGENLPTIKAIKITGLSPQEYLFPTETEYNPPKGTASLNKYGGREITKFKVPTEGNTPREYIFTLPNPINISEITSEGSSYAPLLYFPESKGEPTGTDSGNIDINDENFKGKFQCTISYDGVNYLPAVTLPNLDALPRNTHVKVNILLNTHSMVATVTLFPYTAVWLNPEFGFMIPVEDVTISTFITKTDEYGNTVVVTEEVKEPIKCVEGESFDLVGSVLPKTATDKSITWTSSDTSVATVDPTGRVTALKKGEASITATSVDYPDSPAKSATCTVIVTDKKPVTGVKIVGPENWNHTMDIGTSVSLSAIVSPDDATYKEVSWTSSNDDVANVSSLGMVTALSNNGNAPVTVTITATPVDNPNIQDTYDVTVNPKIGVNNVQITNNISGTFYVGNQFSFTASVSPSNATNQGIYWFIDPAYPSGIVTVTEYGLVTALSPGEVNIIAQSIDNPNARDTRTVKVTMKVPVTDVIISRDINGEALSSSSSNITGSLTFRGSAQKVYGRVSPDNATYKGLIWRSSDGSIVSVGYLNGNTSDNGSNTLTPLKKGSTTITVTSADNPEKFATLNVTATADVDVTGVSINSNKKPMQPQTIRVGQTLYMRGTIEPPDATYKGTIWESSNPTVATLERDRIDTSSTDQSEKNTYVYKAIGRSPGKTTITVTPMDNPNVKATLEITVDP